MKSILIALLLSTLEARTLRRADNALDLTIIHTNDVHSHYDQNNKYGTDCTPAQISSNQCYGGIARMKKVIDQVRSEHKNTLLMDGGDQFQGTMFFTYYKGDITAKAMNLLKYDVATIGNHEFDYGADNLARVYKDFQFPIVSSNLDVSQHPELNKVVKKYQLYPEYGLAVVGYITITAPSITNIGKQVKVLDPIIAVQEAINEVNKLGYKKVIAVSHNGYREDLELLQKTRGLALVVGGHSHTYLAADNNSIVNPPKSGGQYPTKVKNLDNKDVYTVQAYQWGRFLGHIDIQFNDEGYLNSITGSPIDLATKLEQDEVIVKQVQEWRAPFDEFGKVVLGSTTDDLDQSNCQREECNIGNFIADVMLAKRPESDFAFINAGGIRASITKGDIKVSDVQTVLPFGNAITDIKLTGKEIWDMLEGIVSKINVKNGRPVTSFVQISGIRFIYDPKQELNSRLLYVEVRDRQSKADKPKFIKLDLNKTYVVTTLDFLAGGGDNFINPITDFIVLEATDAIVSDYIKNKKVITPYLDGRIKIGTKDDIPTDKPTDEPTDKPTSGYPTDKPTSGYPTDQPTSDKPTSDKPTSDYPTDKPTSDKPTSAYPTDKPTSDKPTSQYPTDKPTSNKPTSVYPTDKPTSDKPTSDYPTDKPTSDKSTSQYPTEKPTSDKPTSVYPTDKPTSDNPVSEYPTDKPTSDKPTSVYPTEKPTSNDPTSKYPTDKPTSDKPTLVYPTDKPVTSQPSGSYSTSNSATSNDKPTSTSTDIPDKTGSATPIVTVTVTSTMKKCHPKY